jgi:glycosyltransferase involved in cell wall biosynthesis
MKIGLSSRSFQPPIVGGVDVYTDRLGRELERRGWDVFYLAFNSSADHGQDIQILRDDYEGRRIWRFLFDFNNRPSEYFQLGYDSEMGIQIRTILEREKPDLLIILNFYMSTLAGVEAAKNLNIPVVHIATDYLPVCRRATMIRWNDQSCRFGESIKSCSECFLSDKSSGRFIVSIMKNLPDDFLVSLAKKKDQSTLYSPLKILNPYWKQIDLMKRRLDTLNPLRRNIDLVLAPTQYTAQIFRNNGFTNDQIEFLPFGIEEDSPLANVRHRTDGKLRFLFIGRLQPYKGAHLLIEAFNRLTSPKNATLTIYGVQDGYDEYFQNLTKLMAENENIHFKGRIPASELGNAFSEADYFVMPSTWHENSPLILLDAIQSKTPVISSNIGGVTDFVKDGINGWLFPMGDVNALQTVLQRAIDNPDLVDQLRSHGVLIDIETYVDKLLAFCSQKKLLAKTRNITIGELVRSEGN